MGSPSSGVQEERDILLKGKSDKSGFKGQEERDILLGFGADYSAGQTGSDGPMVLQRANTVTVGICWDTKGTPGKTLELEDTKPSVE